MKLFDFKKSVDLNALKVQMGMNPGEFGDFKSRANFTPWTSIDQERLAGESGLEIAGDDIVVLPDETLAVNGQRVLLYIRDSSSFGSLDSLPKFHFANCNTLDAMRQHGRFKRFVASSSTNGRFVVKRTGNGIRTTTEKLDVCRFCLNHLSYGGYSSSFSSAEVRAAAVKDFRIPEFFERYPRSYFTEQPRFTATTAPTNDYNPSFRNTSNAARAAAGWRCQGYGCGRSFVDRQLRRYLDVHHVNGIKNDDRLSNLQVLCVCCHAAQPKHAHMKMTKRYAEGHALRRQTKA